MDERGWLRSDVLSDDESRRAVAHTEGVPFVLLTRDNISHHALELIPEPLSRRHSIVAYAVGDGWVEVAVLNVDDLAAVEFLQKKHKVKARITDRDSIKRALLIYQKYLKEKFSGLLEKGIEAADSLIKHAIHSGATHVHLEPAAAGMLVRYRINGMLHEAMRLPKEASAYIVERVKTLAKLFPVATSTQEGRFKLAHGHDSIAVNVSTHPTTLGERVLMRLARESAGQKSFTIESLGFHGSSADAVHEILHKRSGVVVVIGPQGSGKTTTLYTMLDLLNDPHLSLASIEDQVAHHLPYVAQTSVRRDIGLSMAAGMRALLKQDPDVVMVGSLTERDAVEVALSAARRGVFVLGGVEVGSTAELLDIFDPHLPKAVINQRLSKKLCTECREVYTASRENLDILEQSADFGRVLAALKEENSIEKDVPWKELQFYKPVGCGKCSDGYKGLVGVQEVIDAEHECLNLIEDGLFKAAQGLTSIEEVVYLAQ